MFLHVLKNEIKGIIRDPMYAFFSVYPFIFGGLGYLLVNYIKDNSDNPAWGNMVAMLLVIMTSYVFGAVTGFTLLDDKDDKVLMSLKITPISTKMYVFVKILIGYIFGFIATLIIVFATGFLSDAGLGMILLISVIASLQAPFLALVVNSFAQNKVEGFVIMKATGMTLILPAVAFFLTDWKEFFLIIAPGFWPARMIMMELMPTDLYGIEYNLPILLYFVIGIAYNLLVTFGLFKLYTKKSNI
ncbi:ABC transporter permease [Candidatus Xianfuyuplasma coldseepsis]|uniref:ABC transporter permease n=1 Tax=Candidatus Xianfuyuplasma coldseepsis TaxID=2782163 RepID=A0A7L7KPN2_9MOLU|nr:ABC transporter permease [Xianfuyuplasma coldseepsis]QMS84751.1 ABC transporter permease [Xianfuyuplasma coldseepsis]